MNPALSAVHVNRPLTNVSVAYMQDASAFVAASVFPVIPVSNKSDSYYIFNRGDFNRDSMAARAPSTESAGDGFRLSTATYDCQVQALHKDIDDQIRANQDMGLNIDISTTQFLTQRALIRRERIWASNFFTTGKWGSGKAGANTSSGTQVVYWNQPTATPIEDVQAAATTMAVRSGGYRPNVCVLGRPVFDTLKNHPEVIDRLNAGQTPGGPAQATRADMARLFEVDQVLVMDAVVNTATENTDPTVESNAFIGGKHALLAYAAPNAGLMTPTAGYTFVWTDFIGSIDGVRIKDFRMENLSSDRIEIEMAMDQRLVGADLGYFFDGVVQ